MIDPRLAWFAIGAAFGLALRSWPWYQLISAVAPGGNCGSARRCGGNEITQEEWEAMRTPAPKPPAKPPPPAPGMFRCYFWRPSTMAACGGPCYEAQDPSACTCGALWSDMPLPPEMDPRFGVPWDEGTVQRGNGHGGTTTPKPRITPKPSGGRILKTWQ